MDPFDQPECEAYDIFVNEVLCIGKGTNSLIILIDLTSCAI